MSCARKIADNELIVGDGSGADVVIEADVGDVDNPKIRFNNTDNVWEQSNDGIAFTQVPTQSAAYTDTCVLRADGTDKSECGGVTLDDNDVFLDVVGISFGATLDASLVFDVTGSTTKASRPFPVLTSAERDAIPTPATNAMIFNEEEESLNFYDGDEWIPVGSGSGAGAESVAYFEQFNRGNGGFVSYKDAAQTLPIDGTGGTAAITCTQETAAPLMGAGSLKITKGASNLQGEGCSKDFVIDAGFRYQTLVINFRLDSSHANYSDNDMGLYLYDIDNSALTRFNVEEIAGTNWFYTARVNLTDSLNYRFIFHQKTASTLAYDIYIDDFSFKQASIARGVIVTDMELYTPTITHVSGGITNNTNTFFQKRIGDRLHVEGRIIFSAASAAFSDLRISLPTGLVMDTNKISTSALIANIGEGQAYDTGVTLYPLKLQVINSTTVDVRFLRSASGTNPVNVNSTSVITNTTPFTFNNGDSIYVKFEVPILGWSSNSVMSEDAGNRDIVVEAYGNSSNAITANVTNITFSTITQGSQFWNGTTFTVPETGRYIISGMVNHDITGGHAIRAYKNGALFSPASVIIGVQEGATDTELSGVIDVIRGDQITLRATSAMNLVNDSGHRIHIAKLASPQTIFDSEEVYVEANGSAAHSIGTSMTDFPFTTEVRDSHGMYNPSTGVFTAGRNMKCDVSYNTRTASVTLSNTQRYGCQINRSVGNNYEGERTIGSGGAISVSCQGSVQGIELVKDETLNIQTISSVTVNADSGAATNHLTIRCK